MTKAELKARESLLVIENAQVNDDLKSDMPQIYLETRLKAMRNLLTIGSDVLRMTSLLPDLLRRRNDTTRKWFNVYSLSGASTPQVSHSIRLRRTYFS